jgi:hypothetical protein
MRRYFLKASVLPIGARKFFYDPQNSLAKVEFLHYISSDGGLPFKLQ